MVSLRASRSPRRKNSPPNRGEREGGEPVDFRYSIFIIRSLFPFRFHCLAAYERKKVAARTGIVPCIESCGEEIEAVKVDRLVGRDTKRWRSYSLMD